MAEYISITDAQIQPKAPGTSELFNQLRDNPVAISEGASGAPRVVSEAFTPTFIDVGESITSTSTLGGMFGMITLKGTATEADTYIIRYRTSTDEGSTQTGWTNLFSEVSSNTEEIDSSYIVKETFPADTNWVQVNTDSTVSGWTAETVITLYGES